MKNYPLNIPQGFKLPLARTCARLLDHAYGAIRQSAAQGYPNDFVWKKPEKPVAKLRYSDFAMAEIEYVAGWRHKPRRQRIYKIRSTPLAFLAHDDSRVFLVIRGTSLDQEWMGVNAKFRQEALTFSGKRFGKVHNGLKKYYATVSAEIRNLLDPLVDGRDLVITGHSLGGGVGAIALADCVARYTGRYKSIVSYSFASPRVGDPDYCEVLAQADVEAYRVVNTEDLVPDLPPANIGRYNFRHYGGTTPFTAHYRSTGNTHNTPALIYALEHGDAPECTLDELIAWAKAEGLVQMPSH